MHLERAVSRGHADTLAAPDPQEHRKGFIELLSSWRRLHFVIQAAWKQPRADRAPNGTFDLRRCERDSQRTSALSWREDAKQEPPLALDLAAIRFVLLA